ncbi:MAG: anti-sigma factor [Dongiaceae bacterium]
MRYDDPRLRDELAAQYALGTLRGRARRRLERLLEADAGLRELTRDWEARLNALAERAPAVAPPPGLWPAIERRLQAETADSQRAPAAPRPGRARLWGSLAFWRGLGLAASAAAAALALLLLRAPGPGPGLPAPDHIAVLTDATARPALLASIDGRTGRAVLTPLQIGPVPADRDLELWEIGPAAAAPRSLGLLRGTTMVRLPDPADLQGTQLAVSLEPAGGSPSGAPTGPVLYQGAVTSLPGAP